MVFYTIGILLPTDKEVGMFELDPLLEYGVAPRPCRLDAFPRVGIDKLAVDWLIAIILASKPCQKSPIIRCKQSDIHDGTGPLDQFPKKLLDTVTELWRPEVSFELIEVRRHMVPAPV
jgi:hypothetical protein